MSRILSVICIFWCAGQAIAEQNSIILDGPGQVNTSLFVQEVLTQAYGKLGIIVNYQSLPLARSFVEANAGRIDGLRYRVDTVSEKYPNLQQVPFPLINFKIVLMADRRKCGMCDLKNMHTIATVRGLKAIEDYVSSTAFKQLNLKVTQYTTAEQALVLLQAQRVDGVIMSDIDLPEDISTTHPYLIKQTLSVLTDFHYLHKKHQQLGQKLLTVLNNMEESGKIQALREKYAIPDLDAAKTKISLGKVSAISGDWVGFTDNEEGAYWRLLSDIYHTDSTAFVHQIGNWKRAKAKFVSDNIDILVGAYAFEKDDSMLLSDLHIDYETSVFALGKNAETLRKQLAGEEPATACYIIGYAFNEFLPETVKVHEVSANGDCERLLKAGRVDMLVGYDLDLSDQVKIDFASQLVLESQPLFLVFHNTRRGQRLHNIFEKNFRQLLRDNKLSLYFTEPADYIGSHLLIESGKY